MNEAHEAEAPDNNIYVISYEHANTYVDEFLGACIDSAAQRTVIGKPQAEMYGKRCGIPIKLEASAGKPSFSFGTHRHPGLGRIEIRAPISDTMKVYGMVLDTDKETLSSNFDGWKIPLVQKLDHLYHEWDIRILFTETELRKVHRHFFHPKPEKLYELIRKAKPDTTSPEVLRDLERIDATCGPCQQFAAAPHRFKVSLPNGEIVFNREVCLDLMSLDKSTVLHAVDRDTKFNVARFLRDESAESTWNNFREKWISAYVGNPDTISADQGPQFRSKYLRNVTNLAGIELKLSGVESHNAINVGEKYHDFLRRIFQKRRKDYPQLSDNDILSLSVKALNDTAGPRGLVPTLLVFGELPKIPFVPTELPTQAQRMRAMDAARTEMNKVVAETRLNLALKAKAPVAASSFDVIKIGSKVLVYRENPIDMWKGPYTMLDVEGKVCRIDVNGKKSQFSIDKVKLYHTPSIEEHADVSHDQTGSSGDDTTVPSPDSLLEKEADVIEPTDTIGLDGVPPSQSSQHPLDDSEVIDRWHGILVDVPNDEFGKDIQDLEDLQISTSRPDELFGDKNFDINVTEVLNPNDPRGRRAEFDAAKREEVSGIQKRDIWDVVKEENFPPNANVLSGRFVLAYKNRGTLKQLVKARYVAQGHKDKDKGFVVHNVTTLRVSYTRVLVSVAAVKGFRIYSDEVRQAYLQNKHDLTREIYLKPKRDDREVFGLKEGEVLKLKKPIYGIPDAGDYWDVTVHSYIKTDLKLVPLVGDPALYVKPNEKDIDGVMAVYDDDKAMAGNDEMQELTEKTAERFESKPRVWDEFDFFGMHFKTTGNGSFTVDQAEYIQKLNPVPSDCSFEQFRSYRAVFAWIGLSRPELGCAINRAAQVTRETFSLDKMKELNAGIAAAKSSPRRCLTFRSLEKDSLHLRAFADASFANNDGLSTQMGFVTLLCDDSNSCHILDFASKKCKRVVRSVLGGEVYALAEEFDRAYMLKRDLETIYKKRIPLHMFTDSKSSFDVLVESSSTTERRLMIDLRVLQEAYKREEIAHVGLVSSEHNVADVFTKMKPNGRLTELIDERIDHSC